MARATEMMGSLNWKLNLILPRAVSVVNTVLVRTADWTGPGDMIEVFPDQPCLDTWVRKSLPRARLANAVGAGTIRDCRDNAQHEVMRCDMV